MPSKRFTAGVLIVLSLVLAAGVISQWWLARRYSQATAARSAALDRNVREMHAATLFDAIGQLADQTGVPIEIDAKNLELVGIDGATFNDARLFNVRLETALNVLAMDHYSFSRLGWRWRDGMVVISSIDQSDPPVLRVYDLRRSKAFRSMLSDAFQDSRWDAPPSSNGLFGTGKAAPATANDREEDVESGFTRLIEELAVIETWQDFGGPDGWLRMNDGRLIVRQTTNGHRAVEEALNVLESEDDWHVSAK